MNRIAVSRAQQVVRRVQDQLPDQLPLDVALSKQFVRPHGGVDRRLGSVLIDEQLGRAPDVGFIGHRTDRRQPAA